MVPPRLFSDGGAGWCRVLLGLTPPRKNSRSAAPSPAGRHADLRPRPDAHGVIDLRGCSDAPRRPRAASALEMAGGSTSLGMTTLNLVTLVNGQEQGARAKVVTLEAQNM